MHPLRLIIRRFDNWLSRQYGVYVFNGEEGIILRVQDGYIPHDRILPDGMVARGSQALFLHLWNERIPPIPAVGPDLAYALRLQRSLFLSLQAVAQYLIQSSHLQGVEVVGGVSAHTTLGRVGGGQTLLERLGFTVFSYHRPAGAFGEFWENLYTWWLMWAFNPTSVRHRPLWRLQRLEFWMTRKTFLERYGSIDVDPARPSC